MDVKTLLNKCHPIRPFVYGAARFIGEEIHVEVHPRKGSRGLCGECGRRGPTYDTAREPRRFEFVPLWGLVVFLVYSMRRIDCPTCGVKTERVPWASGKNQCCDVYRLFLARWARRLSWSEVAGIFGTTWNVECRSIRWVVDYGLAHRDLSGVKSIGVDEVTIWKGHKYLIVVYQIGGERTKLIEFVASDMWKNYLKVIAEKAAHALHVLDRFQLVKKLNKAIDDVRAKEARDLKTRGFEPLLKRSRWCFLKRPENLTEHQAEKLSDVLQYDLRTVRSYLLKDSFDAFWSYTSPQ